MASIYSRSYFTIIAADRADANYGLRGTHPKLSPRHYSPTILRFSPECEMMVAPVAESQHHATEWHRRGWTFQERILSNRNIVFFHGRVFWECRACVRTEIFPRADDAGPGFGIEGLMTHNRFRYLRWPDLYQYEELASEYNVRILSFESDALKAFSAIVGVLRMSFKGAPYMQFPSFFFPFDITLLWLPFVPRKRCSGNFPSWSWLSWKGDIKFPLLRLCHQLTIKDASGMITKGEASIEIKPMVEWYKNDQQSGQKYRIDNSYHLYRAMGQNQSASLPPGWSKPGHSQKNKSGGDE
jgi:hypothetical protein